MAIWRARDVEVLIIAGSADAPADFASAVDYSGYFKSIEFKEPERTTGEVKFLGSTSNKANSEVYEEDPSTAELSGELVLTPQSGAAVDPTVLFYTSATGGEFSYAEDPANPSFFIRFGDATDYVGFILDSVTLNTLGGMKVDADGHASSNIKVTSAANLTKKVYGGSYVPS